VYLLDVGMYSVKNVLKQEPNHVKENVQHVENPLDTKILNKFGSKLLFIYINLIK